MVKIDLKDIHIFEKFKELFQVANYEFEKNEDGSFEIEFDAYFWSNDLESCEDYDLISMEFNTKQTKFLEELGISDEYIRNCLSITFFDDSGLSEEEEEERIENAEIEWVTFCFFYKPEHDFLNLDEKHCFENPNQLVLF